VGEHLRNRLEELRDRHTVIGDVRGLGLMQALELVRDRRSKQPAAEETARLMELARQDGLILGKGGLYGNVLRISPALTCSKTDVDDAIGLLDRSLGRLQPA
jgi:4-aminobutyrate aminotransferase-like enzyme